MERPEVLIAEAAADKQETKDWGTDASAVAKALADELESAPTGMRSVLPPYEAALSLNRLGQI